MNKVQPITCAATSDLEVSIPDTQGRNIVLYFYPKDSTSGCTTEGKTLEITTKLSSMPIRLFMV